MPTSLVKICIDELSPVVTQIINLSLTNAKMPTKFTTAIVKPRLKKPSLDKVLKNYRPVSNLPFLSKIIEEAVGRQITLHLDSNGIGKVLQSAYKKAPQHGNCINQNSG